MCYEPISDTVETHASSLNYSVQVLALKMAVKLQMNILWAVTRMAEDDRSQPEKTCMEDTLCYPENVRVRY